MLDINGVNFPFADPPLNCEPPSFVETQAAVNQLKGGELLGSVASMLNFSRLVEMLYSCRAVLCSAWNTSIIPTDWKRGLVVPLWKGKGDGQDCNSCCGVRLLEVPGKFFARIIIIDGVCHHLFEYQRPEQMGITPKWSTIHYIPALRVHTECKQELWKGLLAVYVDLCEVFVFFFFWRHCQGSYES